MHFLVGSFAKAALDPFVGMSLGWGEVITCSHVAFPKVATRDDKAIKIGFSFECILESIDLYDSMMQIDT